MSSGRHHIDKLSKEEKERIKKEEKARAKEEKARLKEEKRQAKKSKGKKHEAKVVAPVAAPMPTPAPVRSSAAPTPSITKPEDTVSSKVFVINSDIGLLHHALETQVTFDYVQACILDMAAICEKLKQSFGKDVRGVMSDVESLLLQPALTERTRNALAAIQSAVAHSIVSNRLSDKMREYDSKMQLLLSYQESAQTIKKNIEALPDSFSLKSNLIQINETDIKAVSSLIGCLNNAIGSISALAFLSGNAIKCLEKPIAQPAPSAYSASGPTLLAAKPAATKDEVEEKSDAAVTMTVKK